MKHEKDTGGVGYQIALLTEKIKRLEAHIARHKKDKKVIRAILMAVGKRKRLMEYIKRKEPETFKKLQEFIEFVSSIQSII